MAWWQIVLIIAGSIVVGIFFGYIANLLIIQIIKRSRHARRATIPTTGSSSPPAPVIPQATPSISDLFAEIEYNRRIANKEWDGELHLFHSKAWDNRGNEVHSLAVEIRNEIMEAYSDIALANSITWLATEMSRRSPGLDESYSKLRASIATRLNTVRQQLPVEGVLFGSGQNNQI